MPVQSYINTRFFSMLWEQTQQIVFVSLKACRSLYELIFMQPIPLGTVGITIILLSIGLFGENALLIYMAYVLYASLVLLLMRSTLPDKKIYVSLAEVKRQLRIIPSWLQSFAKTRIFTINRTKMTYAYTAHFATAVLTFMCLLLMYWPLSLLLSYIPYAEYVQIFLFVPTSFAIPLFLVSPLVVFLGLCVLDAGYVVRNMYLAAWRGAYMATYNYVVCLVVWLGALSSYYFLRFYLGSLLYSFVFHIIMYLWLPLLYSLWSSLYIKWIHDQNTMYYRSCKQD